MNIRFKKSMPIYFNSPWSQTINVKQTYTVPKSWMCVCSRHEYRFSPLYKDLPFQLWLPYLPSLWHVANCGVFRILHSILHFLHISHTTHSIPVFQADTQLNTQTVHVICLCVVCVTSSHSLLSCRIPHATKLLFTCCTRKVVSVIYGIIYNAFLYL